MQLENVLYFLVFAGLFFLMMRFGCGAHIMGHAHQHGGARPDGHGDDANLRWVPPGQAVDPVCGMTVQTAGAKSGSMTAMFTTSARKIAAKSLRRLRLPT